MKIQSSKLKIQNYSTKFKILLRVLLICLTFNFALLTFNLDKAEASALSLGIDPPIIVIKAIPPTDITSSLNIQNKSDNQVTLKIQLKPFKAKGENGELEYLNETSPIFKNIQILDAGAPVENITLNPGQQKTLNLNINVPQDISVSDYYFSIIFISTNSSPTESNSSINQIGIATNILLSIGAKETPQTAIEEFSSNLFFEKGPVPFMVKVRNSGAHFIKPKGVITIKNMFGQSVGRLDLYSVNILSDSIRAIPATTWKESFLLGLYTATLNISMSDEEPVFTRVIHFLAFPLQGFIIIAIMIIAAIVIRNRLKLYMTHR